MTPYQITRSSIAISRIHIVAIAIMGCFTFGWIFSGNYLLLVPAICGLDWFLVNILNRVVDLQEDRINKIGGTDFVETHRRSIIWIAGGTLAVSLVLTAAWSAQLTGWRLAYHSLGLAYNWPILPGKRRIKNLYFFKNSASALGFLITLFAYPLAALQLDGHYATGVSPLTIGAAALFFFLFELSYEVIYDLRDTAGDRNAGVKSYPVVHGRRGAIRIIDVLLLSSAAVLIATYAAGITPWRLLIMVCAPLIQLVVYKRMVKRGLSKADCISLTWLGAALLLVYHLWYALKLPGSGLS